MTNANTEPIEAVLFDWGGTLTPWHTIDVLDVWRAVAAHIDRERVEELAAALMKAEDEVWARVRDEHRSGTLEEVCAMADVVLTPEAIAEFRLQWHPHSLIDPDAPPTIEGLRDRGIKVGVLSNTLWTRDHHEEIFDRDGVLHMFDGAVYTSEIPWTKPHPEAFRTAMRAVGVDAPQRCVYVGDRLFDDIWGAQNAGMRAVHVPHSMIPPIQVGHTEGVPDATIERLTDLLAIVDGWNASIQAS